MTAGDDGFVLFDNPHALASVLLPPEVADGYPRYKGASPALATVGGDPWFSEVLTDEEWLTDPRKTAREETLKAIAEFERRCSDRNTDATR